MNLRKNFLICFLILLFAGINSYAEDYFQESVLSVMGTKFQTTIHFSINMTDEPVLNLTVHEFTYKDKNSGEFTIELQRNNDKTFSTKNKTVYSKNKENETEIKISECYIIFDDDNPVLSLKYKPGKMPFNITLRALD